MHAIPGRPAAVVGIGVPYHARGDFSLLECGVHLLCLLDWHAQIGFAVNKERWRRYVPRITNRRLTPKQLVALGFPRRAEEFAFLRAGNIRGAVVAHPVADAGPGDRGREAIRLGDDPIRHETAVRVAGDAESLWIDGAMSKHVIDARHHVLIILDAPASAPRRPEKVFTVPRRAARICVDDGVPLRGKELQLEVEVVAVGTVRTAVDGENERQSVAWCVWRQ